MQKVRNMALDDVVILNVDTNTLETPFDDLQSLPNDVVGHEPSGSDSCGDVNVTCPCGDREGWGRLWLSCASPVARKDTWFLCSLCNLCLSEESWEVVRFLVLFCSHDFHLKGCEVTPGPERLPFRGSLRVLLFLSSTLPCHVPGARQRPLWWAGGLSA